MHTKLKFIDEYCLEKTKHNFVKIHLKHIKPNLIETLINLNYCNLIKLLKSKVSNVKNQLSNADRRNLKKKSNICLFY